MQNRSDEHKMLGSLRSHEALLALAEVSPDIISVIGCDGTLYFNSPALERIHGYTQADLLGKNTFDFIHPDDRPAIIEKMGELMKRPDGIASAEYRYLTKDGTYKWMEVIGYNKCHNPDINGFICLSRDITERKQYENALRESQDRWRRAFDQSPIGAAIVSLDFRFIEVNAALCEMTGYDKSELTAMTFRSISHPDDIDIGIDQIPKLRAGEIDQYQVEKRYIRKDKRVIAVSISIGMLRDANGNPKYFLPMIQDITAQKTLEANLRTAIEVRDDFLSIASHELQTPLTTLDLQLQVAQRRIAKLCNEYPEVRKALVRSDANGALPWEQTGRQLRRLSELLRQLLDVTRIRTGKLSLQKSPVELRRAADVAIAAIKDEASNVGTSISLVGPAPGEDGPVFGNWDPMRIQQIFTNLLSNAIKYGEKRPVVVELAVARNVAYIKVKDQGAGIPEDMRERIFDRFARLHQKSWVSGLGLGLYIVRQVVEAHGGRVSVESQLGKGSTFTVELPLE